MAKSFYTADEAAAKLGKTEGDLKDLVRAGTIREFRDAGSVNYKVDEIDQLAASMGSSGDTDAAGASSEIVLSPADDSSIELASGGSDILSLGEAESEESQDTSAGTKPGKKKEDTAVPSVGINVFDDEDLDEAVDPLAQTAVSDVAGLGMEGTGSGSGILDLTKEADDTSLGAELLDEIYTGDEQPLDAEMGEDTRAGLDEAVSDEKATADEETLEADVGEEGAAQGGPSRVVVRQVVEIAPDAVSTGLTAGIVVAVLVMWFAGLAGAGLVRGVVPGLLKTVSANLALYAGGAAGVAVAAVAVTFLLAKRSG